MVFAKEPLGTISGGGLGPFGTIGVKIAADSDAGLVGVTKAISSVIGIMTVAAGIWFMFQVLTGGLYWITSAGDKTKLSEARDRIQNAAIGLLVVVAAWAILALAGQFLGFDILINSPAILFNQLKI